MSSQKPGTDWAAKHAAAGSQARPVEDRPYRPDAATLSPVSESDVIHLPKESDS